MRILVVRAGALGDTLMVTPLFRHLKQQHPLSEIDLLCSQGGAELLKGNPHVSQFLVLRHRNLPFLFSPEKWHLVRLLRDRQYDSAILLESAPQYRQLLERALVPQIRSFRETPFDPRQHSVVNNLRTGGFTPEDDYNLDLELVVEPDAANYAKSLLAGLEHPRIGLHAGYGPAGKKKHQTERLRGWSPHNFHEVAEHLIASGASIVLTGGPEDLPTCREIADGLPYEQVRVTADRVDVAQVPALLRQLDLLISVDSGPAHIAAAVGTPLIVLWGPGILAQTRPISATTPIHILNASVPCAPCYGTPLMRSCTDNICMQQITPAQVLAKAQQFLKLTKPRADSVHAQS